MPFKQITDSPLLKTARERFKLGNDADGPQAERERADIAFEDGDQWPTDIKLTRMGQQPVNGMPATPARPTLVINKVRRAVQQILNQERASDIGIEIVPADDFGDLGLTPDDTEITLREGLVRRIQRESQAADARSWAFKRATIAGRGYYLVMTRFLPGKTWDQEIYVHRIFNQSGVVLDPSHEQPDGSDADWAFVGTWVPWDRLKASYPKLSNGKPSPLADGGEEDFIAMAEAYPDWYRQSYTITDKHGKESSVKQVAVRVTDYWYVDRVSRNLAVLEDGSAVWEDELQEGQTAVDTRTVVEKQIHFCKIVGGVIIVEETDWAGPDMPIVKVLGEEILPYDEQRRAEGMVRQSRDAQMGLNYMISKQVEKVGLTPIPPLMVDPDAIEGYETEYGQMNYRTFGSLKYRTYDDQGRTLMPPTRPPVSADNYDIAQSIVLFDQAVQDTTQVSDPALGETDSSVKSAKHAQYLIEESRLSTSNYIDNLARSIRYEGQIINNLLYPIYGARPGRLVRAITGDGEAQTIQISPSEGGQAPDGQTPPSQQQRAQQVAKLTKDAHFNVIVKVSKTTDSRRQQFVNTFGSILSADPMQMSVAGDLFYRNMDIPEAKQLADRMKLMLAPPIQQMLAEKEQGQAPVPPQIQAQLTQMQQVIQEQGQIIQQLQPETIKAQTQIAIAKGDAERDVELERMRQQVEMQKAALELEKAKMDNATKIHVAEIGARTKGVQMAHESEHEAVAMMHETVENEKDRQHEQDMGHTQMAHQAAVSEGENDREDIREASRQESNE